MGTLWPKWQERKSAFFRLCPEDLADGSAALGAGSHKMEGAWVLEIGLDKTLLSANWSSCERKGNFR